MFDQVVSVEIVHHFCHIATHRLGIDIPSSYRVLIVGRIAKRLETLGLCAADYLAWLDEDVDCCEVVSFLDFFRPRPPRFFARPEDHIALHRWITSALATNKRRFRLWSAGCGTGEEPYGMALTAMAAVRACRMKSTDVDIRILASDNSGAALERGRRGWFAPDQLCNVVPYLRGRCFRAEDDGLAVNDEIKAMVNFRHVNLIRTPFPMSGPLDGIFCHYGLAYLIPQVRCRAAAAVRTVLASEGVLRTGLGETALTTAERASEGPEPAAS